MGNTSTTTDSAGQSPPNPAGATQTPNGKWRLGPIRAILLLPCILVAAYAIYLEILFAGFVVRRLTTFVEDLSDEAKSINRWLLSLELALPCILLLVASCASFAILRVRSPARRRAGWSALVFLLMFVGGLFAQQKILYDVYLPAVGRGYIEKHQADGTLTKKGDSAPDCLFTTLDGEMKPLSELRGRPVLLNFFATWCGACLHELPELQKIWDGIDDKSRFHMLVVGREETVADVRAFQEEHHFSFPMAADPQRAAFEQFATEGIPRTYLISADGRIVYQWLGFDEEQLGTLKDALNAEIAKSPAAK